MAMASGTVPGGTSAALATSTDISSVSDLISQLNNSVALCLAADQAVKPTTLRFVVCPNQPTTAGATRPHPRPALPGPRHKRRKEGYQLSNSCPLLGVSIQQQGSENKKPPG